MKTKIFQYYDNYHFSCDCGASSGRSMGFPNEESARKAARLHMELVHPSEVMRRQAARIAELEAACQYALDKIDYLQKLWGKEGVTDNVVDTLRSAIGVK